MTGAASIVVVGVVTLLFLVTTSQLVRDRDTRQQYAATLRALRWWMLPAALVHVVLLVVVVIGLLTAVPAMRYGWWMLLGGSGNIALGQTGRPGFLWKVVGLLIPVWLLVLIPLMAYREEPNFRWGCDLQSAGERLRRRVIFGLAHSLVMGVPIGAGIVLIGSGSLFESIYLRSFSRAMAAASQPIVRPEPAIQPYPEMPTGPYDAAAWQEHHAAFDRICEQNRLLRDAWFEQAIADANAREEAIDRLRDNATATTAAFHALGNLLLVGVAVCALIALAVYGN